MSELYSNLDISKHKALAIEMLEDIEAEFPEEFAQLLSMDNKEELQLFQTLSTKLY